MQVSFESWMLRTQHAFCTCTYLLVPSLEESIPSSALVTGIPACNRWKLNIMLFLLGGTVKDLPKICIENLIPQTYFSALGVLPE